MCVSVSTARLEVGVRGRGGRESSTVLEKKKKKSTIHYRRRAESTGSPIAIIHAFADNSAFRETQGYFTR